jgi:hypothetical protein
MRIFKEFKALASPVREKEENYWGQSHQGESNVL